MTSLLSLNYDVFEKICSFLISNPHGFRDLLSFRQANRGLYAIISSFQLPLSIKFEVNLGSKASCKEKIERLFDQWTSQTQWKFENVHIVLQTPESVAYHPEIGTQVKELYSLTYLSDIQTHVKNIEVCIRVGNFYENVCFDLANVFNRFENVQVIRIEASRNIFGRFSKSQSPTKLARLHSFTCYNLRLRDPELRHIYFSCANIQFLDLQKAGNLDYLTTLQILSGFKNLRELRLRSISSIRCLEGLSISEPLFRSVETLALRINDEDDSNFFTLVKTHFPNVAHFSVVTLGMEVRKQFRQLNREKLRILKLNVCFLDNLQFIASFRHLEYLNLGFKNFDGNRYQRSMYIYIDELLRLMKSAPFQLIGLNLVFQDCNINPKIVYILIKTVLTNQKRLRFLSIHRGSRLANVTEPPYIDRQLLEAANLRYFRVWEHELTDNNYHSDEITLLDYHFHWNICRRN